jgi:hypothetical protein
VIWSVSAVGIRHNVVTKAGGDVTYCGKWAWFPYYTRKPKDGEDCLRCTAVRLGRYVHSVALGKNKRIRR